MFLSLWLFVEFVFLGKKQLWFTDLKVIAIQITVPNISVWIICVAIWIFLYLHWSNWFIIFGMGREQKRTQTSKMRYMKDIRQIPVLHVSAHLLQVLDFAHSFHNFQLFSLGSHWFTYKIGYQILLWTLVLCDDAAESTDCFDYWCESCTGGKLWHHNSFVSDKQTQRENSEQTQECEFSILH